MATGKGLDTGGTFVQAVDSLVALSFGGPSCSH